MTTVKSSVKPSELTLHEHAFKRLTDSISQLLEDKAKVREAIRKTGCRHVFTTEFGGGEIVCLICWAVVE